MSFAGVGPLCFLKSTVNAAIYQEMFDHFILPSADKLYGDADFTCPHCQMTDNFLMYLYIYIYIYVYIYIYAYIDIPTKAPDPADYPDPYLVSHSHYVVQQSVEAGI